MDREAEKADREGREREGETVAEVRLLLRKPRSFVS